MLLCFGCGWCLGFQLNFDLKFDDFLITNFIMDPLSLLRQYTITDRQKEIVEKDDKIIFGELAWPRNVKTNYIIYGSGKDGEAKEYYTLECLVFFLKNVMPSHPLYVKCAATENIPVVTRPDRKDLLAYLSGETISSASIDKSAPIEIPTQVKRTADEPSKSSSKKPRLQEIQKVKETLAARLDAPRETSVTINNITSLSEAMSIEKIAEIKAKRLSQKRTTIKGHDGIEVGSEVKNVLDYDLDVTKDVTSRERQWRTRTTILQSNGRQFAPGIFAILQSVKTREEGRVARPIMPPITAPKPYSAPSKAVPPLDRYNRYNQPSYNRYDQERLIKNETAGFRINPLGTYSGMSLKSVSDETVAKKPSSTPSIPSTMPMAPTSIQGRNPIAAQIKRVSKTPIIIIPAGSTSLITMFNAKDILQDLRFISTDEKKAQGGKRDNEILIHRQRNGFSVPYRVIDNTQKLSPADWERVVAVFIMGPAWQFKGWPWDGNPVEIFSKICAFHLKYDEMKLDANVGKWAVTVIQLSKFKRHLDRAALMAFWEKLDVYITKNKPFLRY